MKRGDICRVTEYCNRLHRDADGVYNGQIIGVDLPTGTIVEVYEDSDYINLCWVPVSKCFVNLNNDLLEKISK